MYRDEFSPSVAAMLSDDEWLVTEQEYNSANNLTQEAIFGLTNGRMGSRASHVEGDVRKTLPANYVHGVFDRSEAFMRELCNTPDWTKIRVYYRCEPIGVESGELKGYLRVLDMKSGLVAKRYICENQDGRQTRVEVVKCLSRAHPRTGMIRMLVTPLNYAGILEFENVIDATVTNLMDFPRFRVKHLRTLAVDSLDGKGGYVQSETRDCALSIGTGAVIKIYTEQKDNAIKNRAFRPYGEVACEFADAEVKQGETLIIEKFAAVATARDTDSVRAQVKRELEGILTRGFEKEWAFHKTEMALMWRLADLTVEGDASLTHALRFNIFHLMNTPDPLDSTVNIGAKLLHGEEYGGHTFWDTELFVLPFFDYVFPKTARKLVEYRYLLLDKARENARENGFRGAKYPWESADTGEEECPSWTIEYDGSCYRCYVADYEHHVTSDIAYGLYHYAQITGDDDFMERMGVEVLLETARFWASRITYCPEKERYEILKVTGPDEWHEPVDNNAYTNHLARWNLLTAIDCLKELELRKPEIARTLCAKVGLSPEELLDWQRKANKLFLQSKSGLIEQFDGYFSIPDAVVTCWDEKGMPVMPENCVGKQGMQRCILKQADVVMLMFLMPHAYDAQTQKINFEYYEKRTLHRSSLSPSIHCMMGLRVNDSRRAYDYLRRSAYVDLENNQCNTREGIHAASAGGTWQCVTLGYCGMDVDPDGVLCFQPRLPENWTEVRFTVEREGRLHRIAVTKQGVRILSEERPIAYRVYDQTMQSEVEQA